MPIDNSNNNRDDSRFWRQLNRDIFGPWWLQMLEMCAYAAIYGLSWLKMTGCS